MKNPNRVSKLVTVTWGLMIMSFAPLSMASPGTNIELDQLVPANVDQFIEFNTGAQHPFNGLITSAVNSITQEAIKTQNAADVQSLKNIVNNGLKNNKISMAIKNNMVKSPNGTSSSPKSEVYFSLHLTPDDYNSLKRIFSGYSIQTETIEGVTVYSSGNNVFVTMVGNLAVLTSSRDQMTTLLNTYTKNQGGSLAQSEDYKSVRGKDLQGSFLNIYMDSSQFLAMMNNKTNGFNSNLPLNMTNFLSAGNDLMGALKAEGISLAQSKSGYNFGMMVKGDNAKLTQLNMNFDRYNFIPELYKYVNSQNIIMFGEENNIQKQFQDAIPLLLKDPTTTKGFTEFKANLKQDSGVDFDNDLLPLLSGKYSITIHKTNQIYPAVSLIFDVRNTKDQASTVLGKLVNYLDKTIRKAPTHMGYSHTTTQVNGKNFEVMTFDPSLSTSSQSNKALPREKTLLILQAGVTNEGFLIITNSPNLSDVYTTDGKGMTSNSVFHQAFNPSNETVAGIRFISFENIRNYAALLMDTFNARTEVRDVVNGLLNPWHDMFAKVYATSDISWATGSVNVDNTGLANYGPMLMKLYMLKPFQFRENLNRSSFGTPLAKKFCDVNPTDWFADDVNALSNRGIIKGYSDGCFKPQKNVTRGEFIHLAMQSMNNDIKNYEKSNMTYFTDVQPSDSTDSEMSLNINEAAKRGYFKGYGNRNFYPEVSITRAEAVQFLHNMVGGGNDPTWTENFTDVHENDRFQPAITWALNRRIVAGTTPATFEPQRFMSRAEAARVINVFSRSETQTP